MTGEAILQCLSGASLGSTPMLVLLRSFLTSPRRSVPVPVFVVPCSAEELNRLAVEYIHSKVETRAVEARMEH